MTTTTPSIRVLIVDDHPMTRNGIKAYLATTRTVECVGEAASGEDAVALCRVLRPRVVLMDLAMPGMGGIAATKAIHQEFPETRVIALTSFGDPTLVQEAVRAGAISYLLKHVSGSVLVDAIVDAAKGQPTMTPEVLSTLMTLTANPSPPGSDLTEREREVLTLLAEGLTNFQIARRLSISEATVRFHVGNIFSKLEVGNRTEAVRVAIKHRLVE
jgi:NarL family two-component system response regulator LiaR